MAYRHRTIDDELDVLLPGAAAIAIRGPRAVGKTETATQRARTIVRLDDGLAREFVRADPRRLTEGSPPILIDEWQRLPESWDLVRRAVDRDRSPGRFLLTGSASPANPPTHTGAGRIVSLHMRSMTLAERGVDRPSVSLSELLTGARPAVGGSTTVGLERYANEIVGSGLPGLRGLADRTVRAHLDGYIEQVIEQDFTDAGLSVRSPAALRRWMTAYASAVAGTASLERIRDAATAGYHDKPTKVTVLRWLDVLERLWLAEPIPGWMPSRSALSRLALAPKHQMVDPAIAARLVGATADTLLAATPAGALGPRDSSLLGALFESMVAQDVRVQAQAAEARVSHFRTRDGDHEVDLIVERADHRIVAIEVKLTRAPDDRDVRHMTWLRDRLGDDLLDAVVVNAGPEAYRRLDGIAVVPAALLGP